MSAPVVPELAASTINRKWILEADLNFRVSAANFQPIGGLKNLAMVTDDANNEDDGRYSDGGYSRMNKTGTGWNGTATVSRAPKVSDLTAYDTVQEFLRGVAEGNLGSDAEASIRWYEFNAAANSPRVQAYAGVAIVAYNDPGGERTGNSEATFTFTGQGALLKPVSPFPHAAVVPVVGAFAPASLLAAGGTAFQILGAHFTGTTGVTIGGTAVTSFHVWNDGEITGVAAAHSAGTGLPVVVTNATGPSVGGATAVYA